MKERKMVGVQYTMVEKYFWNKKDYCC